MPNIKCKCGTTTNGGNIVTIIEQHTDDQHRFVCESCGGNGYVVKNLKMQDGEKVKIYYLGVFVFAGKPGYQPFTYLCAYAQKDGKPPTKPTHVQVCYYRDLRSKGGKLKLGHGPGAPPIISFKHFKELEDRLD